MEPTPVKTSRAIEILKRVPGGTKIIRESPNHKDVSIETKPPVVELPEAPVVPPVIESVKSEYDINPPEKIKEDEQTLEKETSWVPEDPTDEVDSLINAKEPAKSSLFRLRTKLKSELKSKREIQAELDSIRQKVTDYDTGMIVPEHTAQLQTRVAELEVFEKIHNFENSAIYKEKYVEPIKTEQIALGELAKGYRTATPELLNSAFAADTSAEQNRLINQAFAGDDIAALEAKSLMKNIKKIQNDATEARKTPAESMARMQQDNDRIVADQRQRANEGIVHVSKVGWSESLSALREDDRFSAITYREGDTEHNEKFVRPILTRAGQEYGKTVRELAQHGLTELPKELAMKIAKSDQLAHLSGYLVHENSALKQELAELRASTDRHNRVNRPNLNGSNASNTSSFNASVGTGAVGSTQAGRNVLARVTGK